MGLNIKNDLEQHPAILCMLLLEYSSFILGRFKSHIIPWWFVVQSHLLTQQNYAIWNKVISTGIHSIWNFRRGKSFLHADFALD